MERQQMWPVPYLSKLEGQFTPGQTLTVKGLATGDTFTINLLAGPNYGADNCVLHVSVRTKEHSIILNTFRNGTWEKEEKIKDPFKKDEEFDLRIRAHDNRFEIIANQKELGEFDHRLPLTDITHLFIDGGLALHNVSWGGRYYPVPYQAALPGGFQPGKKLFVSGVPEKSAKRFTVELLNANGEVALHFNPRFDENVVVRNSKQGDQWLAEEREGKQPFHKDVGFDLIVSNEPTCFELRQLNYVMGRFKDTRYLYAVSAYVLMCCVFGNVLRNHFRQLSAETQKHGFPRNVGNLYVNGSHFGKFAHRLDPHSITQLQINGDLELQGVHVK